MSYIKVITAIRGARMGYAVPTAYHGAGMLGKHFTDFYTPAIIDKATDYLASLGISSAKLRQLKNRRSEEIPNHLITSYPIDDWSYKLRLNRAYDSAAREKLHSIAASRFCHRVMSEIREPPSAIYGINGDCLELFEALRYTNTKKIMEQSILPQRLQGTILLTENKMWGELPPQKTRDDESAFFREESEWQLADKIFAGSEFVKNGLINMGVPARKIEFLPYGVAIGAGPVRKKDPPSPRLRLVYVGAISPRKGVPYLLDALSNTRTKFQLDLIGPCEPQYESILQRIHGDSITYLGKMNRREIYERLPKYDAMIFPSLLEGSALVTYEALACGLPVITTLEAGSPVEHEVSGLIIESKNTSAILNAVTRIAEDRDLLERLAEGAFHRAQFCTLSKYSERLLRATQLTISSD